MANTEGTVTVIERSYRRKGTLVVAVDNFKRAGRGKESLKNGIYWKEEKGEEESTK